MRWTQKLRLAQEGASLHADVRIESKYCSIYTILSSERDISVETSLIKAGLWDEVKDRLGEPGTGLSGGQQQPLCIARAIAVSSEVILMDEPCSALDPIATAKIEELIAELRTQFSIVIVTHAMQQAARVSQRTAYFHLGTLVEVGATEKIFTNPSHQLIEDIGKGKNNSSVRKMLVLPVTLQPLSTAQRECNGLERKSGSLSGQKTSGVTAVAITPHFHNLCSTVTTMFASTKQVSGEVVC